MRKKTSLIVLLCILSLLFVFAYLQFFRSPFVNQSYIYQHHDGYEMNLSITANKLFVWNKESLAKQLVRQTLNNEFDNVMFSYDVHGYPDKISITVYTNNLTKNSHSPVMSFQYTKDQFGHYQLMMK